MVLKFWVGSWSKFRPDPTKILSRIVLEKKSIVHFLSGRKHVFDENRSVEVKILSRIRMKNWVGSCSKFRTDPTEIWCRHRTGNQIGIFVKIQSKPWKSWLKSCWNYGLDRAQNFDRIRPKFWVGSDRNLESHRAEMLCRITQVVKKKEQDRAEILSRIVSKISDGPDRNFVPTSDRKSNHEFCKDTQ